MRVLGTIFSAILALIAIPLFTIAACNLAIDAAIFNRGTYDAVLDNDVIFEEMLTVALPLVLTVPEADIDFETEDENGRLFENMVNALEGKPEVWSQITNLLIPSNWLQGTVTQLVDVIFGMIEGDIDVIEQEVDLTEVRSRLTGEQAQQAARLIITESPECTDRQLEELEAILDGGDGVLPVCNPGEGRLQTRAITYIENWFAFIAGQFEGDIVPVSQMFNIDRNGAQAFSIVIDTIFNKALVLFYLCPMALLSLIIIMVVRSLGGFGRWIGSVLVAVGVFILMLIFALQVLVFGSIGEALAASNPADQFMARFGSAMLRSAISESSESLLLQAFVFIGAGFVLFALAWYFSRKDDEGSAVLITEEGEIISTATQKRVGTVAMEKDKNQPPN